MRGNHIGDEGALAVACLLSPDQNPATDPLAVGVLENGNQNETAAGISDVDLGNNSIGEQGGVALAESLRGNRRCNRMQLSSNNLGKLSGAGFISALTPAWNTELSFLSLSANPRLLQSIDDDGDSGGDSDVDNSDDKREEGSINIRARQRTKNTWSDAVTWLDAIYRRLTPRALNRRRHAANPSLVHALRTLARDLQV